jgi:hypothetical protein
MSEIAWFGSLEEAQRIARERDLLVLIDVFNPT